MLLTGTVTSVQEVKVEVPLKELRHRVLEIISSKLPKAKGEYIDNKGFWKIFYYTHPHNGDDVYTRGDPATEEEKEAEAFKKRVAELLS